MLHKYEEPLKIRQFSSSSSNTVARDSEEEVQNKSSCLNKIFIKSKLMADHEWMKSPFKCL